MNTTTDIEARWMKLIARIKRVIRRIPPKDTLAELPAKKRRYVRSRFRGFAKEFQEAM